MRIISNISDKPAEYVQTSQRQLILDTILQSTGPLDAKQLYTIVSQKDQSISLATVYRTLKLLKEKRIIDEHRFGKKCYCYQLKQSFEHQHIICKGCGKVVEFETPLIAEIINSIKKEKGFNIERVELCIQGTCSECQAADQ